MYFLYVRQIIILLTIWICSLRLEDAGESRVALVGKPSLRILVLQKQVCGIKKADEERVGKKKEGQVKHDVPA